MTKKFDISALRKQYAREGFVHVEGVFSEAEALMLRQEALACDDIKGPDLLSLPSATIRRVIYDERMLDLIEGLLGDRALYFGDSTVLRGNDRFGGWHKDNADRYDGLAPDWRESYDILRFGIYLQDHAEHSGGLRVRVGSHNHPDTRSGRTKYIRSRLGDVVLWNLRTTHAGHGVLLRVAPSVPIHSRINSTVNEMRRRGALVGRALDTVFAPTQGERVSLFATFARRGTAHLDRLLAYMATRTYWIEKIDRQAWPAADIEAIEQTGRLELFDVASTIDAATRSAASASWRQIPY